MATLPPTPQILLSLLTLLSTYLTYLVWTPPNPNKPVSPTGKQVTDRLFPTQRSKMIKFRQIAVITLGSYQSLLILFYHPTTTATLQRICPNPTTLNPQLFTPAFQSILGVALIILFSSMRLYAFRSLGPSFTFKLAPPPKLITNGIYKYIQHPSYTANFYVMVGNGLLFNRPTACMGCFIPTAWTQSNLWYIGAVLLVARMYRMANARITDEENMLRDTFGEEWEVWHKKTARFVPGLF